MNLYRICLFEELFVSQEDKAKATIWINKYEDDFKEIYGIENLKHNLFKIYQAQHSGYKITVDWIWKHTTSFDDDITYKYVEDGRVKSSIYRYGVKKGYDEHDIE